MKLLHLLQGVTLGATLLTGLGHSHLTLAQDSTTTASTPQASSEDSALLKKGTIQKLSPKMKKILSLNFTPASIQANQSGWLKEKKEAEQEKDPRHEEREVVGPNGQKMKIRIRHQITHAGRPFQPLISKFTEALNSVSRFGGSSTRTGVGTSIIELRRGDITGKLTTSKALTSIELKEHGPKGRSMLFRQSSGDDPELFIHLNEAEGDHNFLALHAAADGRIKVRAWVGNQITNIDEDSLGDLYLKHTTFCDEILFPMLDHYGIRLPELPNSPAILRATIAEISQEKRDPQKEATQLITDLDAKDQDTRQKALERLKAGHVDYRPFIKEAIENGNISLDARSQLQELLELKADAPAVKPNEVVQYLKLLENPAHLKRTLEVATPEERKIIIAYIAEHFSKQE